LQTLLFDAEEKSIYTSQQICIDVLMWVLKIRKF